MPDNHYPAGGIRGRRTEVEVECPNCGCQFIVDGYWQLGVTFCQYDTAVCMECGCEFDT